MKRPKPTTYKVGNLTVINRTGLPDDPQGIIDAMNAATFDHLPSRAQGPRPSPDPARRAETTGSVAKQREAGSRLQPQSP